MPTAGAAQPCRRAVVTQPSVTVSAPLFLGGGRGQLPPKDPKPLSPQGPAQGGSDSPAYSDDDDDLNTASEDGEVTVNPPPQGSSPS